MSWSRSNESLPDLVRDSKLDTTDIGRLTTHTRFISDPARGQRGIRTEETWERTKSLGQGSFGLVWLERCVSGPSMGTKRAVKEIMKIPGAGIDYSRELEAIAKFSHARYRDWFVESFGWFESPGSIFLAMEYFELGDLGGCLREPLPEAEALEVTYQLLNGLKFMHDNGFAHRDMKPANILVLHAGPKWWVKIGDFGISKRIDMSATELRSIVGTPQYLAPELIGFFPPAEAGPAGASYTFAVDIWSLGQIVLKMITGQPAFPDRWQLFSYVVQGTPFPTESLAQCAASQECCAFLRVAMAASPKQRMTASEGLSHSWIQMRTDTIAADDAWWEDSPQRAPNTAASAALNSAALGDSGQQNPAPEYSAQWSTIRRPFASPSSNRMVAEANDGSPGNSGQQDPEHQASARWSTSHEPLAIRVQRLQPQLPGSGWNISNNSSPQPASDFSVQWSTINNPTFIPASTPSPAPLTAGSVQSANVLSQPANSGPPAQLTATTTISVTLIPESGPTKDTEFPSTATYQEIKDFCANFSGHPADCCTLLIASGGPRWFKEGSTLKDMGVWSGARIHYIRPARWVGINTLSTEARHGTRKILNRESIERIIRFHGG